jgi:hypothetical protein
MKLLKKTKPTILLKKEMPEPDEFAQCDRLTKEIRYKLKFCKETKESWRAPEMQPGYPTYACTVQAVPLFPNCKDRLHVAAFTEDGKMAFSFIVGRKDATLEARGCCIFYEQFKGHLLEGLK